MLKVVLRKLVQTWATERGVLGAFLLCTTTLMAQQDSSHSGISPTTKPFILSGYIEAYYGYDFSKPADHIRPPFIYSHNRDNEININLAYLKGSYSAERIRANLSLATGTYMNANYSAEPGTLENIFEANVGYKLSGRKNLWLDAGVLPSHIGFESAVSKDCWTLTRSLVAENTPYYEAGARLSYTTQNGKWLLTVLALNGWQRITKLQGNSLVIWGTQIQLKANDKVLINYSNFLGTDKPDSARKWRYYNNLYGVLQLSKKCGLTLGLDYGWEQVSRKSSNYYHLYAPVGILRIMPARKFAFACRAEYYSDPDGIIVNTGTPNGFKTLGLSVNLDYLPDNNIIFRLEGKTFHSQDYIFLNNNVPEKNNTALTISIAISLP